MNIIHCANDLKQCTVSNVEGNFNFLYFTQGWEFAHQFSDRIARFLEKKLAIRSFLVSDLLTSLNKKDGMSESLGFF